ncbi:uncharacterized protein TNCV_2553281 [Trichonephila clavipes]|nr:uncharacterized protein TNCV_2553281 [Trichonephila clavipes]
MVSKSASYAAVRLHVSEEKSSLGGAIENQLLRRSNNRQVANVVTKNDANLALSPCFHLIAIVIGIDARCNGLPPGDAYSSSRRLKSEGDGDRFNSCQVIYSQFGLAIHQHDHQARRRFVKWAQNEIAVVHDFHKRILFSDEAHFWWNGYVNKQNCRIWSEANPQVYVETPLHPEKLTVWCALWAGGILLQKR